MGYQICFENWKTTFSIPCSVTDECLSCGAVQLKVLLLVLRHQQNDICPEELANRLNLPAADIRDALNYWTAAGVLKYQPEQEPAVVQTSSAQAEPVQQQETPPAHPAGPKPSHARMTASEIHDLTQRQPVIRSLLHETEAILGKTLTSADISTIISLYDWAGISPNVILMVVAYCASLEKKNLRYIEKTALSWQEMGLDNDQAIEAYLDRQTVIRKREQEVKKAFGIYDRNLTAKERDYIEKWYEEFQFSIDLIQLAYEKTVDRTGKVSFPYLHKILSSWKEKGITTPQQALSESSAKPAAEEKKEYSFDLEEFEKQHRWRVPKMD